MTAGRDRAPRRSFLIRAAAGVAALGGWPARGILQGAPAHARGPGRGRVVIVGASFAGLGLARALASLAPGADIVLLDRAPLFVFAPAQLRYVFGRASFEDIARAYRPLAARGLVVTPSAVVAIDRTRREVATATGRVPYDYLVLATGMRLAYEDVPGLAESPGANLCPYDRGALPELRRRIAGFRGGHVLIATPNSPYTCPPAPYEYALMWAAHVRRHRLAAKITLIDPRSRPTPAAIAEGLTRAMEACGDTLAYEPFTQLRSVDPRARTAETELGRLSYDLLSVLPPNKAMPFITDAGLGEVFADVDPRTFRSTRDERVYALGDNADTPYAKTAHTALDSARVAAASIARDLGATPPKATPPANVCYPMVAEDRALSIETRWAWDEGAGGELHVRVSGRHDDRARASYARLRRQWETRTLSTLFGP